MYDVGVSNRFNIYDITKGRWDFCVFRIRERGRFLVFTQVEYTYLENLIETYVLNGDYKSYLAYTNTDLSGSYTTDTYDFFVIFSKEDITSNVNNFSVSSGLKISVNSSQASRNYANGPRVEFAELSGVVSVPSYEFIYTNALQSAYPDILAKEVAENRMNYENNIAYNITKDEFYIMPLFMGILIMMLFLKWCFPMKGGKKV